jgi:tetratricopeptide (TPR) repeat protein
MNAILLYDEILKIEFDNKIISIIYSNKSACYLMLKDFVNSLNNALISIKYNNLNAKAWGRIGWSFKGLKNKEDSLKAFKIANNLDPLNINYKKEIYFYNSNKIDKLKLFEFFKSNKYIINKLNNNNFKNKLLANLFSPDNLIKDSEVLHLIDYIIHKID